jgi:hypothetical protein
MLTNVPAGSYRLKVWHARMPQTAAMFEQAQTVGSSAAPVPVMLKGLDP